MSRIGKLPIPIPKGVEIQLADGVFRAKGPKGELAQTILAGVEVQIDGEQVVVTRSGDSGPERARHGLMRSLLANAVEGVHQGFKKELQIVGVGYRGEVKGRELHLALGYSHPVVYAFPETIQVEIDKQNKITVTGADKQQVGQVAAEIRSLRKPDAYKGKGIRYADEQVRLKVGKAGAGAAA